MGRNYFGTISGKFWVCIQDSDDASYYKSPIIFSTPLKVYEYMGCCCFVKDIYNLYCKDCYDSYEEHIANINDEDILEDIKKDNNNLIYQNNYIKYYFEKFELQYVVDKLNKLEDIIGSDIINKLDLVIINNKEEKSESDKESSWETDDESEEETDNESDNESGEETDNESGDESDNESDDESEEEIDKETYEIDEPTDEIVNKTLKEILKEDEIPEFEYEFNYKIIKNLDNNKKELIARWCLGKLIEHSIKELEYCEMFCEI